MDDVETQLKVALELLNQYYEQSFRTIPENCNPILFALAGTIEKIAPQLAAEQTAKLNELLGLVVDAMKKCDTVLIRDYLRYELRPFLQGLQ